MRSLVILSALALAACSTVPAEGTGTAAAGGACKDEGLSIFVGRDATEATGSELLKQSGANALRWVPKGTMVTMEFRADRVTAYLDGNNRIERVSCG
jgi:hypothetical protein